MKRGKIYSKDLGIDLASGREGELFKWFLACLLFGKPIQQEVAKKTYFEFESAKILSLEKILNTRWNKLVKLLDKGHYVRYDYSTATKLLEVCRELREKYGSMKNLIKSSRSRLDLKRKLLEFKGIGEVTARIFLRDLAREGAI